MSVVRTPGAYGPAVEVARSTGDDVLVESFVRGREIDVAVFRDRGGRLRTGAPLEISVDDGQVFGRAEKYDGTARFTVPARLDTDELAAIEQAARTLYETLGCAGVARFDFFVTDDGVLLNEVNTAPGFTEQSQVPGCSQPSAWRTSSSSGRWWTRRSHGTRSDDDQRTRDAPDGRTGRDRARPGHRTTTGGSGRAARVAPRCQRCRAGRLGGPDHRFR
ncbi:ATP-grasp domain-containing protein [Curtobacterium flaccumfaciens]|nr:ATP-grasp domain-containing protein [Curtobacterium flaccumfaciens]